MKGFVKQMSFKSVLNLVWKVEGVTDGRELIPQVRWCISMRRYGTLKIIISPDVSENYQILRKLGKVKLE